MFRAAAASEAPLAVDRMLSSYCCDVRDVGEGLPISLTPLHRQVLTHWEARRDGRRATRQRDIDPSAIRSALPHLLIWEVAANDDYACRLSGTMIDDIFGKPLKGGTLSKIPCRLIDDVRREFDTVRERGLACIAERTMGWAGKPYLFYRHLLLPLTRETDAVERLLSVMTFHSVVEAVAHAG
jgi:hypothetical protein